MKPKHITSRRQTPLPKFLILCLGTAITALLAATTHAADLMWDAGDTANGATINPADGTWNTTAGNIVWNNAGTNVVWSAANVAIFGGADGTYAIGVVGPFSVQRIQFNNSGYTLSAGTAQTITVTAGGSASLQPGIGVSSGKTATIGSNVTVTEDTGTMYIGALNSASGGTLNIEGTVYSGGTGGSSTVIDGVGTIVNVKTGGTLRTAGGTGTGSVAVGQLANADNSLNVQGGTVLVSNTGTAGFVVGNNSKGTVTLTSGNITVNATATNGVVFGGGASNVSSNTLHLDGGFLTTSIVKKGAAGSTATFNFNGGTLTANASNTSFMTGLDFAYVKAGVAKIDTQAFNITFAQNLLHDPALDSPSVTPDGGLEKLGSGTLTLPGAGNTYTGPTTISGGTLLINGTSSAATAVAVNTGTLGGTGSVLGPVTVAATGSLAPGLTTGTTTGTLTLASANLSAGGTLAMEVNDASTPVSDRLSVTGTLNLSNAKLAITAIGTPAAPSYLIASATAITGTIAPGDITGLPAGYIVQQTSTSITLVASTNTYANWLTANSPATGFISDSDYDGVPNGLENVLGTNPNASSAGLTEVSATASTATFKHTLNPTIASDVTYTYEWSTDLTEWKASGATNTGGTTATITPSAPVSGVVTVTTSITSGPAAKLFTRIKAIQP